MYSDKQFADEICRIVDPKDVHTGAQIIRLVEEKFTSTNTGSPKLPRFESVKKLLPIQWNIASRNYRDGAKDMYDCIASKLRAGA